MSMPDGRTSSAYDRSRHLLAAGKGSEVVCELTAALASGTADIDQARLLARLLGRYRLTPSPQVEAALRAACGFAEIDLQPFVRAAIDVLSARPQWRMLLQALPGLSLDAANRSFFNDPLALAILTRGICHDVALERVLLALRSALLLAPSVPEGWAAVTEALAAQAVNNEYAWPVTTEEEAKLPTADPARAAMYRPVPAGPSPDDERLCARIRRLSGPRDITSTKVQTQYEESPYPRWLALNPPESGERRARLLGHCPAEDRPRFAGALDVLIAGCGTGRQAIAASLGYGPPLRMVAIDLSLASLVYAARMAQRYDVDDIEFCQIDIADVQRLGRDFDVIEAIGVLHHLADPVAGLRALAQQLRPGGLMHVALYSERGRQDVVAARDAIARLGIPPTAEGIRRLRQFVLAAPDDANDWRVTVRRFTDFFSLGGCRDLLFHVQEHRSSPLAVGNALAAAGLEFRGFVVPPAMREKYRRQFPDDSEGLNVANWETFEAEHPHLFSGMMGFWCRKPERRQPSS